MYNTDIFHLQKPCIFSRKGPADVWVHANDIFNRAVVLFRVLPVGAPADCKRRR